MIKTGIIDITPLYNEERYREYYSRLPLPRREKADRLKSVQARAQSVGVWILYEKMKKEYGVQSDAPFNFSHSGGYALCALETDGSKNNVRVGCDIERVKDCRVRIAEKFFCRGEAERIMQEEDEKKRKELLIRYWVLKESFVKATGRGLALGLDSFEVLHGNPSVLLRQPPDFPEAYHYAEFSVKSSAKVSGTLPAPAYGEASEEPLPKDAEYRIAICSTEAEIDVQMQKGFRL